MALGVDTFAAEIAMELRNRYMIDHSDRLIAVYSGYPGGTAQTVNYAKQVGKEIINIDPENEAFPPTLWLL